jgi:ribosomal-protein-alanine N-acetyltransferase
MIVYETERLIVRHFSLNDAGFIVRLLNDPSFIQNIADKGVRTIADARSYLDEGPVASYRQFGFGLNLVELKESKVPIGMCGILKRDSLDDPDIGFAFLPEFQTNGYALESSDGVMKDGREDHNLKRLVAVVNPDNEPSIRLLEKIGFRYERMISLDEDEPEIRLYGVGLES